MAKKAAEKKEEPAGLFGPAPQQVSFKTLKLMDKDCQPLRDAATHAKPSAGLVESVRKLGVVIPIAVRRLPSGRITLVDGRRRIRAAMEAGADTVPAVLYEVSPTGSAAITLAANYHRSANAVAELAAMEDLIAKGTSEKELANELSIPIAAVRKRLKLRKLIPELRAALEEGRMALAPAERAASLDKKRQKEIASHAVANEEDNGTPVRITAEMVRDATGASARTATAALPAAMFQGPSAEDAQGGDTKWTPVDREALASLLASLGETVDLLAVIYNNGTYNLDAAKGKILDAVDSGRAALRNYARSSQ